MTGLRWGILATGWIARRFVQDLNVAGLNVTAVGSRRSDVAVRFAQEFDIPTAHGSYEDLVSDPNVDIVYVATPHPSHAEYALLALEHGKHVLVEKPFTLIESEARRVKERAQELGLLAMEAMWTRYLPHMVRIHEILNAGTLGDIRAVVADHMMRLPSDPEHRLNSLELGGGALLDLGIYPISFAWDILGVPTSVAAVGRLSETGADTEASITMVHGSGAISTSITSSRANGSNTAQIVGTDARIEIDRIWYNSTSFSVLSHDGRLLERFEEPVEGRGMQYQAIAAEAIIQSGTLDNTVLPIEESVAIVGTLDEIRRQLGVVYPVESRATVA
ncbi:Gfo/Idh/MocA family oxidoreductase [Microbacterium sp. K24]|uniref:Gfo/Idh/MocA family protein n=1 Tax=Microbacterium sp. K24 TaxID=2305446 RepID=UPI00109D4C8F|nr:Gfo/Idh/MocA family oxidoreductase [Microbacterium sp. K24]